jgi:hypothetical protein
MLTACLARSLCYGQGRARGGEREGGGDTTCAPAGDEPDCQGERLRRTWAMAFVTPELDSWRSPSAVATTRRSWPSGCASEGLGPRMDSAATGARPPILAKKTNMARPTLQRNAPGASHWAAGPGRQWRRQSCTPSDRQVRGREMRVVGPGRWRKAKGGGWLAGPGNWSVNPSALIMFPLFSFLNSFSIWISNFQIQTKFKFST